MVQNKRNKGFSLIELLLSIAILAIIMVAISSFLTSTLHSQDRVSREIKNQDEAQRIYYQLADILMQATYIRVQPVDQYGYEYNTTDKSVDKTKQKDLFGDIDSGVDTSKIYYISENYPNYQLIDLPNAKQRKVIVDYENGYLYNESNQKYPMDDAAVGTTETTEADGTTSTEEVIAKSRIDRDYNANNILKSFRVLDGNTKYYVMPKYIYIEYSMADTEATSTESVIQKKVDGSGDINATVVTSKSTKKNYVIFKYDDKDGFLYMYRFENDGSTFVPQKDSYANAVKKIDSITQYDSSSKRRKVDGLVSSNISELYISASPDNNTMDLDMIIQDSKYTSKQYKFFETVNFRNNNVLTTKPQLLYKWTGGSTTTTP